MEGEITRQMLHSRLFQQWTSVGDGVRRVPRKVRGRCPGFAFPRNGAAFVVAMLRRRFPLALSKSN